MNNKENYKKFISEDEEIRDGFDRYLKIAYGDYMKPVIRQGGYFCRYSVDKSYKDFIRYFDRFKSNDENYNNCDSLFLL